MTLTRAVRSGRIAIVLGALCGVFGVAPPAFAHGEASQPSWVRTTTATFFDVQFYGPSQEDSRGGYALRVGDTLRISGKLHISDQWPVVLGGFELGSIGVLMPGPVFVMRDRRINGTSVPGSIVMRPGDSFEFEILLAARRTGRFHLHPRVDLKDKGPVVGAGEWFSIGKGARSYGEPVLLQSGKRVNLEDFGSRWVYGWHLLWVAFGALVVLRWVPWKGLFSRLAAVRRGIPEGEVIAGRDRKFAAGVGVITLALIVAGSTYASQRWETISLQVRRDHVSEMRPPQLAEAVAQGATYDARRQSLKLVVDVRSLTDAPVRVERLVIGPLSIAAADFRTADEQLLKTVPSVPLVGGEKQTTEFTIEGDALKKARLVSQDSSALDQIGSLIVFRDLAGQRSWVTVVADLVTL